MKGIILAGGSGTRLYPITNVVSKQLLPVYDKPMIYYPMSILMLSGIRDILIISTPYDLPNFKKLFGNGEELGLRISYAEQPKPEGLAQAFIIGEEFIGDDDVAMILGDNIFFGNGLTDILTNIEKGKATIFGYYVDNPKDFGVIGFDSDGKVNSIEEKPAEPKSNYIATGLYFYDNRVVKFAKEIKPSARGELEISSLNEMYLKAGDLNVKLLGRGFAWFDTGTVSSLLDANNFIKLIEERQNIKIAVLEEIAYLKGWLTKEKLTEVAKVKSKSEYGKYLNKIIEGKIKY